MSHVTTAIPYRTPTHTLTYSSQSLEYFFLLRDNSVLSCPDFIHVGGIYFSGLVCASGNLVDVISCIGQEPVHFLDTAYLYNDKKALTTRGLFRHFHRQPLVYYHYLLLFSLHHYFFEFTPILHQSDDKIRYFTVSYTCYLMLSDCQKSLTFSVLPTTHTASADTRRNSTNYYTNYYYATAIADPAAVRHHLADNNSSAARSAAPAPCRADTRHAG